MANARDSRRLHVGIAIKQKSVRTRARDETTMEFVAGRNRVALKGDGEI